MGKDPAFLFYPGDFIVGVSDLTMEERGQYITLLCLQHAKGHLTSKNIQIAVGDISADVEAKFKVDADGLYYNERLDAEILKRENYSKSRYENGCKGGRPKKTIEKPYGFENETICQTIEKPTQNHTENENRNINVNIINSIYTYWNSKNIIVHKELNANTQEAVLKALETYSEEQIKTCIDRYAKVLQDTSYFWHYRWTLKDFLCRREGISAFTDEGSKWNSYQAFLKRPNNKTGIQPSESTFDTDEFFNSALEKSNQKMIERLSKK